MENISLPKIEFRYSWIYDEILKDRLTKNDLKNYPSPDLIRKTIPRYSQIWKKYENKVFDGISKAYGLKWKKEPIYCYVVGRGYPFSDPLTLPVYKSANLFVDYLTHELIHQIELTHNLDKTHKLYKWISKKYRKEALMVQYHITVHAVQERVFMELFGAKRLQKYMEFESLNKDSKRAWEIVQKEGYENLIKEFRERL